MSSSTVLKSAGNVLRQFVDKVKSCDIGGKHIQLTQICQRLTLAREKALILESDESLAVLARIDTNYQTDLKENVEAIFHEEVERGNAILDEIVAALGELKVILDALQQRISVDKHNLLQRVAQSLSLDCYEDARFILVYLRLKTNLLRLTLEITFNETIGQHATAQYTENEIDEGDFLFRLSKLEAISLQYTQ